MEEYLSQKLTPLKRKLEYTIMRFPEIIINKCPSTKFCEIHD